MSEQMALDLPVRTATGRAAFLVAPPNALAVAAIDGWADWPGGKLALIGPEGAGKSHLAAIWATESGAQTCPATALPDPAGLDGAHLVIEDAAGIAGTRAAEERLLHIHNVVTSTGGRLLLTARTPPARWPVDLPDLASRLRATATAEIGPPDDTLLAALLVKLFEDRQLAVSPDLIRWCVARMERSFAAAQRLVATLDARALAESRPVGRKLAAEVLDMESGTAR